MRQDSLYVTACSFASPQNPEAFTGAPSLGSRHQTPASYEAAWSLPRLDFRQQVVPSLARRAVAHSCPLTTRPRKSLIVYLCADGNKSFFEISSFSDTSGSVTPIEQPSTFHVFSNRSYDFSGKSYPQTRLFLYFPKAPIWVTSSQIPSSVPPLCHPAWGTFLCNSVPQIVVSLTYQRSRVTVGTLPLNPLAIKLDPTVTSKRRNKTNTKSIRRAREATIIMRTEYQNSIPVTP